MYNLDKRTTRALNFSNSNLTGNIKFVVQSDNKVYLNSINSNSFINKDIYKKKKVDIGSNLLFSVNKFLTQENISDTDIIFKTSDESLFNFKCRLNTEKSYTEKFSFFAPIYISPKEGLPHYFIIYDKLGNVVKTFNLKDNELGSIFNSSITKKFPENVWYKGMKESSFFFNGISYKYATLATQERIIDKPWDINYFSTISLLSANHFNFEFLFDDENNFTNESNYTGKYFFVNSSNLIDVDLSDYFNKNNIDSENFNLTEDENLQKINSLKLKNSKFTYNPKYTYILRDKNNLEYLIKNIVDETIYFKNELPVTNIHGIELNGDLKTHATLLEKGKKSICINFKYDKESFSLNPGDYIELSSNFLKNFRYRVIASNNNSCLHKNTSINSENNFIFQSNNIIIEKHNNINIVKVKCYDCSDIRFELNSKINATCSLFVNKELTLQQFYYDLENNIVELIFIDKDKLFDFENPPEYMVFSYNTCLYSYTYFDSSRSNIDTVRNVVNAFNSFNIKSFSFDSVDNNFLITSNFDSDVFGVCKVSLNLNNNNTNLNNIKINDHIFKGINYYDSSDNLVFSNKYIECDLNGYSSYFGSRASISKEFALNNLDVDNIIVCNNGLRKIKSYNTTEGKFFQSVYYDNKKEIENSIVISVENDSILLSENNNIFFYKIYKPELLKLNKVDTENI